MQNGMRQLEAAGNSNALSPRHSFQSSAPTNPTDAAFDNFWRILRRRRALVIWCTLALTAAATTLTLLTTPRYQSTAQIDIGKEINDVLGSEMPSGVPAGVSDGLDYTVTLMTQANILTSDSLAYEVTQQVGLEKQDDYRLKPGPFGLFLTADDVKREYSQKLEDAPMRRELITKRFAKNLKVAPVPGTRLLAVSFLNPDPQVAAQVVNTLVTDYLDQHFRNRYTATAQVSDWMTKQLSDLKAQVESEQQKLLTFQKQAGILGTDEANNVTMSKLEDLNKQYTTAQANRIMAETVYQVAKSGDPELISNAVGTNLINASNSAGASNSLTLIQSLRSQEAQLKMQYAQASTKYGAAFPALVQMKNQLADLDASIQTEISKLRSRTANDYQIAKNSEDMLRTAFEQQKGEANRLNDAAVQYTLQKHEVDASRRLYDDLSTKLKEAGVLAGLRSTNITIVDPARTSSKVARPRYPLNIGLGVIGGLVFGVGLAFLKELTNQTVRTTEEMEAISSLPSLGILPDASRIGKRKFLPFQKNKTGSAYMLSNPYSYVAEAFRSLRTSVLMSEVENPPQVIMITSALPGEGKTTTSTNAAIALAQQGSSVLLIEADLRKPTLAANLGIAPTPGLSDVVSGRLSLTAKDGKDGNVYVSHPKVPNLSVLPAGNKPNSPADLVGSNRMKEAIEHWQQSFDYIVIDTPPLLSVTDPVILSQFVDAVVLVARYGQTSKQSLLRARDLLLRANAKIAGVVMNKVDISSPDHYQSYGFYGSDSSEDFHYAS
jgi:succinoglycan biosynthesis transport protein ExoP